MSLLDDILFWAQTELTKWQGDALRRLFVKQELDEQDFCDLYAMVKSEHGIADLHGRQPTPISREHIPIQGGSAAPVVLHSLRDLKHVNRLASGQKLEFAPIGITVVYGDNASGKSGYARVLKSACRARDRAEVIFADARHPLAETYLPEATFDINLGGCVTSITWKRDETPPEALSTISVFDRRCARVYLDSENEVAYLPYGLDVVESLGQRVMPELSKLLEAEIATIAIDTRPFADLVGDTAVGRMIADLDANTDEQKVRDLASLTPIEEARLTELGRLLMEQDPRAKSKALKLLAQRIDDLIARIEGALARVDAVALKRLEECDTSAEIADRAEACSAAALRRGEPLLPGTGESAWRDLFEAARRYSTSVAYPGKQFPYANDDAVCPLCQQRFTSDTADRMARFEAFVQEETAEVARVRRARRDEMTRELTVSSTSLALQGAVTEELGALDADILNDVQDLEKQLAARKLSLLKAMETHLWGDVTPLQSDPRPSLLSLSSTLYGQAATVDSVADAEHREALEAERNELRARADLSVRLEPVLDLIGRMRASAKLAQCRDDLRTKAVSDKARAFSNSAVTKDLESALNDEFDALGIGHINIKLRERVQKGAMRHKLALDHPVVTRLEEVLSDGEQRVIAIGAFLAELRLATHKGGIVFDDPVSSLDHHWRKKVAFRLVQEAKYRQVIVLTHDAMFLGFLDDAIEHQQVAHLVCHLEWAEGDPGGVVHGLPWEQQKHEERLDGLKKRQRELEKTWPPYPTEADRSGMRHEYGRLRATIERIIETVVFNDVVRRGRDWIKLGKLDKVVGFTEIEHQEISRLHKACCAFVEGHDQASVKNAQVPDARQLGQDIAALEALTQAIRGRQSRAAPTTEPLAP